MPEATTPATTPDSTTPWPAGTAGDPVVVGVVYPGTVFHGDETDFRREMDQLEQVDPRIEVVVVPYVESSELRTRRSVPDFVRGDQDQTPVTDEQRRLFGRMEVTLALDLPFDTPALAPNLTWVQSIGTGIGQLVSAGIGDAHVRLTNGTGTAAPEIAEFVLARVFEHRKRLPEIRAAQDRAEWQPIFGRPVAGSTIGLVGLGGINSEVARLARALGLRVLACRRTRGETPPDVDVLYTNDQVATMVAECDVVVSALPETPETVGLFDRDLFAAMAPGAYFCNVGRGSAVVDEDLRDALRSGHLGGAALDVFNAEPLPADDPYWSCPGVEVSAHCSSIPTTSIGRLHALFRDNLRRYLDGEPLRNEVDLGRSY